MSNSRNKSQNIEERRFWQIYWGVFLVIAAFTVLLSTFTAFSIGNISTIWLVLSVLTIGLSVYGFMKRNWFSAFLPVAGLITILSATSTFFTLDLQATGAIWVVAFLLSVGFSALIKNSQIP
ncbi:hypothetical protein FWD07_01610 [Candidatus Saccharibacteria bacterium]|nr:hypothetical protein [Candidatus Saccharibacteria bacterium]